MSRRTNRIANQAHALDAAKSFSLHFVPHRRGVQCMCVVRGMKFTPRAEKAFRFAEAEARTMGHAPIGSHHLVLGLFRLESGVHFNILRELGCTTQSLRRAVESVGAVPEKVQLVGGVELGASAALALQRASDEAAAMSHTYVGTEHVLLRLLSEEQAGPASRLFATHHADKAKAREEILHEYGLV